MHDITITLPDGSKKEYAKGSTPLHIAESIGARLAQAALGAKVNGKVWDVMRPINENASLQILTWKDKEGQAIFHHSTAHVLAHAISHLYPDAKPTIGPSIEGGFFYDFDELKITPEDFPKIEDEMKKIVASDFPVVREEMTLDNVKKLFGKKNPYKVELATEFKDAGFVLSVYRQGDFVDLCEGGHLPSTGLIKAFKLTKLAGAYWRGDQKNKQLTRIYATSFPSQKELDAHFKLQEEAEKRDHRKIGQELGLFMFHEWSPGSPFFLPKGAVIYNELLAYIRAEYQKRGYQEVITPQVFNKGLWELSGHWSHYQENMFLMNVDNEEFSLKPMNCPSHVLIFKNATRSYRDLPLRIADFCFLHRNELKGVLGGLTRVRKFAQDDAHIFCTPEQIESEIAGVLDFVKQTYEKIFKLKYRVKLSTKPEKAMGDPMLWKQAEEAPANALKTVGMEYDLKPGDGAFYGPKIDFDVKDPLGRDWQCATIQLDFQMPLRMGAEYEGEDNKKHTAVMVHRAVFGSLERFFAMLVEQYAGKFPLWLSPEQVRILTIADRFLPFAEKVCARLREKGIRVSVDGSNETINKKVREAQLAQANYILVVGEKESSSDTVTVRTREESKVEGVVKIDDFITRVVKEIAARQ